MKIKFQNSCDASDYAIGTLLEQEKDEKIHLHAYSSRTLKGPQLRHSTDNEKL